MSSAFSGPGWIIDSAYWCMLLFSLIGLQGYVYKIKYFTPGLWKVFAHAFVVLTIVRMVEVWLSGAEEARNDFILITFLFLFVLDMPRIWALYRYGYDGGVHDKVNSIEPAMKEIIPPAICRHLGLKFGVAAAIIAFIKALAQVSTGDPGAMAGILIMPLVFGLFVGYIGYIIGLFIVAEDKHGSFFRAFVHLGIIVLMGIGIYLVLK
jgi:hypothetical protein